MKKRRKAKRPDDVAKLLRRTNRLLAGVIVRICATQTTRPAYPIEVLTGLGLSGREIAEATGRSEGGVNVTKTRARTATKARDAERSVATAASEAL